MEPLSLAFGVLPVVGEAVKTCRVVRRKLKLFRHYSRELRRVQKRVGRQSQVFSNEIHLLLRPSLQDDDLVEVMLKDQDHPKWTRQDLEDGMRNSLGDNYTSCREIIEDIGSTLSSLQSVFDCFDQALDKRDEVSRHNQLSRYLFVYQGQANINVERASQRCNTTIARRNKNRIQRVKT